MPIPFRNYERTIRTLQTGAAYTIDAELLGLQDNGEYIDAINMRPNGLEADYGALQTINGESLKYASIDTSCVQYYFDIGLGQSIFDTGDWTCLGITMCKTHIIEFYCDATQVLAPFIRIDGVICAANPALPINIMHPIQFHWNNNCIQGELYITDNYTPPIILSVQEMIDANLICSETFFHNFNIGKYTVNLPTPPHKMVFRELTAGGGYAGADATFGSGGLKVGQYCYTFRYVDNNGNHTNWLPTTPTIPVPLNLDYRSNQYPGIKTYGADAATQGGLGVVLQFRVQNDVGYKYVEILRYAYNQGAAVGFTPTGFIIGRVAVADGEIGIKTIVDIGAIGEAITDDEAGIMLGTIKSAKSIRYFNNVLTLHNVEYESLTVNPTFTTRNGVEMFPVLDKMGKIGYDDSWNGTYRRSYRRGEAYGFGVGFYGAQMEHTFVSKVTNFTSAVMPDRRDDATADTVLFSFNGVPTAVTYSNNDEQLCHETYDLVDAIPKTDCCSFGNIACDGEKNGTGDCDLNSQPASCGTCGSVSQPHKASDEGYKPFTPTTQIDSNVNYQDYRLDLLVCNDCNNIDAACSNYTDYNPIGFAPSYYALGMALNGITNIPDWVQAFSVLRTAPAGRVICQGIGMYYLMPSSNVGSPGSKAIRKFWFYSTESAPWSGLMTQTLVNSIGSSGNYSAQLVSPVGIFTEMPWGHNRVLDPDVTDICVYPRFYKDGSGGSGDGTINVSPDPVSGTGTGYVQFGKWRNPNFPAWITSLYGNPLSVSKAIFSIDEFRNANNNGTDASGLGAEYIGDRGGEYMVLGVDTDVYGTAGMGSGNCDNNYGFADTKAWHEPMYNINIINTLAVVPDNDATTYFDTGAWIKMRPLIGISNGVNTEYPLVDERWEDVLPWSPNTYTNIATVDTNVINSLIYIERPDGSVYTLLNANGISGGTLAGMPTPFTIGAGALSKPNVTIDGYFTVFTQPSFASRFYQVSFTAGTLPAYGERIIIRYDNEVPIGAYGADTYIGDDVFAPVDRKIPNGGGDPNGPQNPSDFPLYLNAGFPYFRMALNPRIYVVNRAQGGIGKIQDTCKISMQWIRQMVSLFNCESPVHLPYNHERGKATDYPTFEWFFPATNYIQRPINWNTSDVPNNNFCGGTGIIYDAYKSDYPHEYDWWRYGGYRYRPSFNIDYMHVNNIEAWTSQPIGYVEQNRYCTRVVWSLKRDISKHNVPSLKTFLPANHIDIEDAQGEIKFAWSALGGNKGNNLYSICDRGVCMLPTNALIMRDTTAEQIAVIKPVGSEFINEEYWISREIGMNGETWRTRAEYNNVLYFTNFTSVYRMENNEIESIMTQKYQAKMIPYLLDISALQGAYPPPAGTGMWLTAYYDTKFREYLVQIERIEYNNEERDFISEQGFVYNDVTKHWNGIYQFQYDQYLSFDDKSFGSRRRYDRVNIGVAECYDLDIGYSINNQDIYSEVIIPISVANTRTSENVSMECEFPDFRISSINSPTKVQFTDNVEQMNNNQILCEVLAIDLRDRHGWEQGIPRKNPLVAGNNDRLQGRAIVMKVIHQAYEPFTIHNVSVSYKRLLTQKT